jgi:hypothetical protein
MERSCLVMKRLVMARRKAETLFLAGLGQPIVHSYLKTYLLK